MSAHAAKLLVCPNCQMALSRGENFCPRCGQPNHDVNVTFGHVLEETLEGIFHFDSKIWLTFRELLFQPGKLTVDFLAGRRARFVPPIRLYIFLSAVFFFLLNQNKESLNFSFEGAEPAPQPAVAPTAKAGQQVLQGIQADSGGIHVRFGRQRLYVSRNTLNNPALLGRLAAGNRTTIDSILTAQHVTPDWVSRLALKRIGRANLATEEEKDHALLRNLSVGMFVLMPLFALLLKVFYRRQRPLYIQHLIFSVHVHCFFFLLFALALTLGKLLPGAAVWGPLVLLYSWLYWVVALRRFSGQTWGHTLWKSALLFGGYLGLLTLFVLGVAFAVLILV